MRAVLMVLIGGILACAASAAAQDDAGVSDAGIDAPLESPDPGDAAAQQTRCIQACVTAITGRTMSSIADCFNRLPECQGLDDTLIDVVDGMCRVWDDLARECNEYEGSVRSGAGTSGAVPRGTTGPDPSGRVASASERPRPTLDLSCFQSDGTEVEPVGRGWNARCPRTMCAEGERLFEESRYLEGRPRAPRGTTVIVAVCSATRSGAAPLVASSLEQAVADYGRRLDDLEPRVSRLESAHGGTPTREACEALGNEYREVIIGDDRGHVVPICLTPADRYILGETEDARESIERTELNDAERDEALSRRIDALSGRSSASPGNFGFRLGFWGSFGFVQLTIEDGSRIPMAVGGEFDPMIALGAGWYIEGGIGLGYATRDVTLPDALLGVYHLGFLALVGLSPEHNVSIGFGGFLSERYPDLPRHGFVSDHTLLGAYGELSYVARFGDGWSVYLGARVLAGAGLRFDGQSDRITFDGAIMPMIGVAYWGDHAVYNHSRTTCTGPRCRDTAIGRVQVVGADDEDADEAEERADERRSDPTPDGSMGRISFISRGDTTEVYLDDHADQRCTTPCEIDAPAGAHTLHYRRGGEGEFRSFPLTVTTGPNNDVVVRWHDEPESRPIVLDGNDEDEDADIDFDEEEIVDEDES